MILWLRCRMPRSSLFKRMPHARQSTCTSVLTNGRQRTRYVMSLKIDVMSLTIDVMSLTIDMMSWIIDVMSLVLLSWRVCGEDLSPPVVIFDSVTVGDHMVTQESVVLRSERQEKIMCKKDRSMHIIWAIRWRRQQYIKEAVHTTGPLSQLFLTYLSSHLVISQVWHSQLDSLWWKSSIFLLLWLFVVVFLSFSSPVPSLQWNAWSRTRLLFSMLDKDSNWNSKANLRRPRGMTDFGLTWFGVGLLSFLHFFKHIHLEWTAGTNDSCLLKIIALFFFINLSKWNINHSIIL